MNIKQRLNVSGKEFFDFIALSVLNDAKESFDDTLTIEDIVEGFSYTKSLVNKVGQKGNTTVKIQEFDLDKCYEAVFESQQGQNILRYEIVILNDQEVEVSYTEDFIAADTIKKWNFDLVNFFYKKKAQKRAEIMLKNIENYIIQNRETVEL